MDEGMEEGEPHAPSDPGAGVSPWKVWGPALGVIAALALLHWGLWLVLTRGAREVVADVESQYDAATLAAAKKPGREPEAHTADWSRWQKEQRLWAEVERRDERFDLISTLGWGFAVSWLLQTGFIGWIALRASSRSGTARTRG